MKKQLYHYNRINTYQFVTFRTKASIDEYLLRMYESDLSESKKQYKIDQYLDKSNCGRLLNDGVIDLVIEYCKEISPMFFDLIALSVMPNHLHLLFIQKKDMGELMQKLKGGLAFKINKHLGLKGGFWERDYFDKAIRDERHFQLTYEYIKNNALKASLHDADRRFYGIYE